MKKIDRDTRKAVYKRDDYACVLCDDNRRLQIHHVIHRSQGGTNHPQNLVTLCSTCHALAHGLTLAGVEYFMPQADIGQALVEYLADFYGEDWDPWQNGQHPLYDAPRPFDWEKDAPELVEPEEENPGPDIWNMEFDTRPFQPYDPDERHAKPLETPMKNALHCLLDEENPDGIA